MLELSILEIAIAERLDPLRQALTDYGIPVRCLPKDAGSYSEEDVGQIAIFVASATGITNDPTATTAQDVELTITVNLSLPQRYQDVDGEKNVLEYCSDQVIGLLLGFSPYPDEVMKRPIYFRSYELFKPESGRWTAQLLFGCTKQIRAIAFAEEYEVIKVELFNSLDLLTGAKVAEIS